MKRDVAEKLLALRHLGPQLEDLLRQADDPAWRALLLAEMLHRLWPSSPLAACALPGQAEPSLAVVDASGQARPHWAELLKSELEAGARLPAGLELEGWTLVVEPLRTADGGRGALGLALPEGAAEEQTAAATLLSVLGQQLLPRLAQEAQQCEVRWLRQEVQTQTALANVGELARPVTHEFNNFLNVLLLHMAVLDMELPAKLRPEVAEIQRQGKAITAVVRQFQRYRQHQQAAAEQVDLNEAARAAAAALAAGPRVQLKLAPDLPRVAAPAADFRRLCHFLLANAVAVVHPQHGSITLQTQTVPGKALLRVEDDGPAVPEALLNHLFDLTQTVREGTCALELAACRSLARRLQGSIHAENRADGGLAIVLDFPTAS